MELILTIQICSKSIISHLRPKFYFLSTPFLFYIIHILIIIHLFIPWKNIHSTLEFFINVISKLLFSSFCWLLLISVLFCLNKFLLALYSNFKIISTIICLSFFRIFKSCLNLVNFYLYEWDNSEVVFWLGLSKLKL